MKKLSVLGLEGIPEVRKGDHLAKLIVASLEKQGETLQNQDVVIVTSKIVSKAEGCVIKDDEVIPSPFAVNLAESTRRDPRQVEVVLRESKRPVKISDQALIMETKHGFVCANAGVDQSNVSDGEFLLLPENPDKSAQMIRKYLEDYYNTNLAVIISDTFGRPWREGQTNVAIGVSGMPALWNYKGKRDQFGNELHVTSIAIADQIAGTAELAMGKTDGVPVSILRGYRFPQGSGTSNDLIRPRNRDLFR